MSHSTDYFMDAIENWLKAARADDIATARVHAEDLIKNGQMLVNHPDFVACFKTHNADAQPVDALLGLCQFLVCVTDGRAVMLKAACDTLAKPADVHGGLASVASLDLTGQMGDQTVVRAAQPQDEMKLELKRFVPAIAIAQSVSELRHIHQPTAVENEVVIQGRVKDEFGRDVSGVTIEFVDAQNNVIETRPMKTDAYGYYAVTVNKDEIERLTEALAKIAVRDEAGKTVSLVEAKLDGTRPFNTVFVTVRESRDSSQ